MEEFRGWEFYDWEKSKDHNDIVNNLKKLIQERYHLPVTTHFTKKEREKLWIAYKHSRKRPYHHVIFEPDLIIRCGEKPEDRVFVEYVNTEGKGSQNLMRDLRSMIALECIMKDRGIKTRRFILALRNSFSDKYTLGRPIPAEYKLEIMSLKSLIRDLDREQICSSS